MLSVVRTPSVPWSQATGSGTAPSSMTALTSPPPGAVDPLQAKQALACSLPQPQPQRDLKRRRHSISTVTRRPRQPEDTSTACSSPIKPYPAALVDMTAKKTHGNRASIAASPPKEPAPDRRRYTFADPVTSLSALGKHTAPHSCPTESTTPLTPLELPILRAQYVARDVQVLVGSRWRMRQFETRTVRLRTGAEPTILVFANEELVYETPLPLDARCQRKGHTGLKLSGKKDHLKLRIRFVTPADVAIWTRVFHQAITHAKWIRGLGPTTCLAHDRMSTVLVATHHPLQEEVAIKVLPRARVDDGSCNEVQILKKLYHAASIHASAQALQFLLSYHVIETPSDVRVIMPRFDGRNLLVFLQERPAPHALDEREAAALLWSMCEGLQALHAQGIIHCDVKLENILLTDATSARLIDFGGAYDVSPWGKDLARGGDQSGPTRMVGTPGYVAPERILTTAPPTPAADVFSLGVVLFQVLTGRHPFRAKTLSLEDSLSLDWAHAQTQLQARGVSSQAQDLLQLMLKACPSSRIPLSAISSHPWMTSASNEVR